MTRETWSKYFAEADLRFREIQVGFSCEGDGQNELRGHIHCGFDDTSLTVTATPAKEGGCGFNQLGTLVFDPQGARTLADFLLAYADWFDSLTEGER